MAEEATQGDKLDTPNQGGGQVTERKMGSALLGTLSAPRPIDLATFNLPTARVSGEGISSKSSS